MIAPTPPPGSPPPSAGNPLGSWGPSGERPDPEKLGDEIAELAAHIDAARYRLLVRLHDFEALEAWGLGFKSCAHWLSWRISITLGAAREYLRVARALPELPLLSAAMERGEISFSKARAITRVPTAASEKRLLEFASSATAMQLERLVKGWQKVHRLEDEQVRHERRGLTLYADADGSYVVRGRLDPEVGELLLQAVERARSALYREEEERTRLETSPRQRAADAIGLVAEWALGSSVLPTAADESAAEETEEGLNDAAAEEEREGDRGGRGPAEDGGLVEAVADDEVERDRVECDAVEDGGLDEAAAGNGQAVTGDKDVSRGGVGDEVGVGETEDPASGENEGRGEVADEAPRRCCRNAESAVDAGRGRRCCRNAQSAVDAGGGRRCCGNAESAAVPGTGRDPRDHPVRGPRLARIAFSSCCTWTGRDSTRQAPGRPPRSRYRALPCSRARGRALLQQRPAGSPAMGAWSS